jgi:hypothetical protein
VARTTLRTATAAAVALGLGLLAMSPAAAATDNQAGATAVFLSVAGNGQGTGTVTATYADGKETKTGDTTPAFPNPGNQKYVTGGVLAQEATAKPGFSAACAGLAGDGGSVLNIGDSSCLAPGNLVTGSLTNFSLGSIVSSGLDSVSTQLPAQAGPLKDVLGQLGTGSQALTDAVDGALDQVKSQFGDSGLIVDLDAIEGRCTAGDGGPTGTSTLTNAKVQLKEPDGTAITLITLPVNPPPNTHLTTNLSAVLDAVLAGLDAQLTQGLQGAASQLTQLTAAVREQIVTQIHSQVEKQLQPLEDNVLDVVLNEQEHPTADSIKVRALDAQVLPAAKAQLGASLVELQIGDAACAPVATPAVAAPQAATPVVSPPKAATPTGVSSGLATMPGSNHHGIDPFTWALLALAGLGLTGSAWVGVRRVLG